MKLACFLSSVEGGAFWKGTLDEIRSLGFDISNRHALSNEAYRNRRGRLGRLRNLWSMYVWYSLKTFVWPGRARYFVSTTNPFYLPAVTRFRVGHCGHTVFLVYDLFPDAIELAGAIKKNSFASKLIEKVTRYAIRNCSATVFLGEHLRKHSEARFGKARYSTVIHVGADARPFASIPPKAISDREKIIVGYCGNLGRAHDILTWSRFILERSTDLSKQVEWQFHSFGTKYEQIRNAFSIHNASVKLEGPLPDMEWEQFMSRVHVAMVSIDTGWERVVMPSKTYSAMVAGQAILAICPLESDLANLVRKHDCGWVVPVGDVDELDRIVKTEMVDRLILLRKRENAFRAGQEFYSTAAIAKQWKILFDHLDGL
jgi:colanic acid biosynthesis glycosyl transferase WcaI